MKILFVTGTDTGVGKTVASAWVAVQAARAGERVAYVKPVQTGLAPDEPGSDAAFVASVTGSIPVELLRFPEPLAPTEAAREAGTEIDFDDLVSRTLACVADNDVLIVEGAGGLLVPLTEKHTMADLASALEADLVVVARPGLGTLNHTALTLEAAERRGLRVARLIVSGAASKPDVTERTNLARLRAVGPPVDVIPFYEGLSVEDGAPGAFAR